MNANGTNQTRITNNVAADSDPTWSPSGTQIAFKSTRTGNNDIWIMNADGSAFNVLTSDVNTDQDPNWSPDGASIAFVSNRDGDFEIFTMSAANGSGQTPLTANVFSDTHPAWSPDGTQIAFESTRDGNPEIYVMNADGTNPTRLTTNAGSDSSPSWSPDGAKIVFHSNRDGNVELYSMTATGAAQTRLTNNIASDQASNWSGYLLRTPTKLVGTSGALGTTAAGFLFGQKGKVVTSLVAFDTAAASRAGARVAALSATETQGSNLSFSVTTSAGLTSLSFVSIGASGVPSAAVGPVLPIGTTGALVNFDAADGSVTSVLPYAANRSVPKMNVAGSQATYSGNFTAVFDGEGKNLAPSGAKSVTLDEKTGKLLRFE